MLASWRGTRFEVSQVLREVVDRVLKEPGVSDQILYNRAKVRSLKCSLGTSFLYLVCITGSPAHRRDL